MSHCALPEGFVVTDIVKIRRRLAHEQALASTCIEGHQPSAEFLRDCEAVIAGTMTRDKARAASLRRALSKELLAATESEIRNRDGLPD